MKKVITMLVIATLLVSVFMPVVAVAQERIARVHEQNFCYDLASVMMSEGYTIIMTHSGGGETRMTPEMVAVGRARTVANAAHAATAAANATVNAQLLSQNPQLTAPRDPTPTNGELRNFIIDFINQELAGMKGRYQGDINTSNRIDQAISDRFMAGYQAAMARDTASRALGLNATGQTAFYGTTTFQIVSTHLGGAGGSYNAQNRIARIAINIVNHGVASGRSVEDITRDIIYEIDGRGRGWDMTINLAAAHHFGATLPFHGGLRWDPRMEIAASRAGGGIHTLFAAADNGQEAMRTHMNTNIPRANPHFNFNYDAWQMARRLDQMIRHEGHTELGRRAQQEAQRRRPGFSIHQLQNNVVNAINPSLPDDQRRQFAQAVNRDVEMLSSIGRSLGVVQSSTVNNGIRPVVDANDLGRGVIGVSGAGTWAGRFS